MLSKSENNWARVTLLALKEYNIGWARQANELLETWGLEREWSMIQRKPFKEWKRQIDAAAEKRNIEKLKEECETKSRGEKTLKKKTVFVLDTIDSSNFKLGPDPFILCHNYILHTRALIMGRFGMLKCASNYHNGFGTKICDECKVKDDEAHRINYCKKWQSINLYAVDDKIDYNDIYSGNTDKCFAVVQIILALWDLENGKNEMRHIV